MADEVLEYEMVEEPDINKVAKELSALPLDKQQTAIDNIYAKSAVNAIKVAVETIKIIKDSNSSLKQGNEKFLVLCDKGIETLKGYISDGTVSEEEKGKVRENLMDILKMANQSNNDTSVAVQKNTSKAVKTGAIVVGGLGLFTILGAVATAIAKSTKK